MTGRSSQLGRQVARVAIVIGLAIGGGPACMGERARPEDCARILDHLVELELQEQGFRDPALAARKKVEMHRLFEPDLRRCAGRRSPGALACVAAARTTEEISHACLR